MSKLKPWIKGPVEVLQKQHAFATRVNEMMRVALEEIDVEARRAGLSLDDARTVLIAACLLHGMLHALRRGHDTDDWTDFMNDAWKDARDIVEAEKMGATRIQ